MYAHALPCTVQAYSCHPLVTMHSHTFNVWMLKRKQDLISEYYEIFKEAAKLGWHVFRIFFFFLKV